MADGFREATATLFSKVKICQKRPIKEGKETYWEATATLFSKVLYIGSFI
jgi:hypothetical protein